MMMNSVEKLIAEKCPDGVEYKKLGDKSLFTISRGVVISKDDIRKHQGEFPVYSSQTENNGCLGCIDTYAVDGERVTWTTDGAKAGTVFYRSGKFNITNVCGMIECVDTNRVNCKYLSYAFGIAAPKKVKNGMGNAKLMSNVVEDIEIPVPPIEVQQEIVRILDKLTELEAKLTEELEMRKKQRSYLIEKMYDDLDETVPRVRLGDFATVMRGGSFQKTDFESEGIPCIHYGQMYTHFGVSTKKTLTYLSNDFKGNHRFAKPNSIIMAVTSENEEDVCTPLAWLGDEDVSVSGHTAIIEHQQNPLYLTYFFHTHNFFKQKHKIAKGTKVIEVKADDLNEIMIPLPSMDEQNRIAEVLNFIDTLCNDTEKGLPAEIAARHKQYEYYRDKILTFERKAV